MFGFISISDLLKDTKQIVFGTAAVSVNAWLEITPVVLYLYGFITI